MATYTVQAPDGKTITLEGPEGASQTDILAQAQKLYQPKAAPVGAPKPAPKPAAPAAPANPYVSQYGKKDPATVRKIYETTRANLVRTITDPTKRQQALIRFDSDPRAQAMRQVAGLAPLSTKQGEVKKIAKAAVQAKQPSGFGDFLSAAEAGATRALFGIPERITAAIHQYLPESKLELQERGGKPIPRGKNYAEQLAIERAQTNQQRERSFGGDITGQIVGSVAAGSGAGRLISAGAGRLAATGAPVAARVGNILQELGTLRKGQKLANAAKISATGAAAGGAQAAGEGSNVGEGVAFGAVAAPALAGGFKVAQIVSRPFRDVLRLTSAGRILNRLTTATMDQLERRAAQYRADTGAEPTLFELLPLADRNKILKTAVVGKDNVVEQTANAIRQRARNLGPEMSNRAREILQPQRRFIERGLVQDIRAARGGVPEAGDVELARRAASNPTDMLHYRDQEARAIMAPHENTPVVGNLDELYPAVPGPDGVRIATDPEVATVIRSAAGTLRQRAENAGVTAGDITDMISTLRGDLGKGGIEGRTAERAINHLQDILDSEAPEAGAAARRMSEAWAARSRMAEGMQEGAATRLREDVQVGTSRRQARQVRNAYDTPEGAGGRSIGQSNKVITDLGGSPEEALRATVKMSRNSIGRQLSQNIGPEESAQLMAAARAQDESAQALAAASNKAQGGSGDNADAEMLVQAIAGLHPASFLTTKAGAVRKLLDMTYIPESKARVIVDMIFSQDPALMQRALRAVGNEPNGAAFMKSLASTVGMMGAGAGDALIGQEGAAGGEAPSVESDLAGLEQPAADETAPENGPTVEGDSPYAPELQSIYDNEDPALLDLIDRVKQQESGGKHFDENGQPIRSSAGAVGIMQVMPETGPEAASLAGVPWDPQAFENDPVYNELLGIAYLSEQLRKYDGDVERALAAYNAGPGAVDDALATHDAAWLQNLPAETQDYVARIS